MNYTVSRRKDGKYVIDVPVDPGGGSFSAPIQLGATFEFEDKQYEITDMDSVPGVGGLTYIVDAVEV